MADTTKVCESCDKEIGASETVCPACGVDFAELEETVTAVDRATAVLAKRKAKETPAPAPAPVAQPKPKATDRLRSFGRAFKKEK